MAEDSAKRRRLTALQSVAQLHPLSLECVKAADDLVKDLAAQIAEEALVEAGGVIACTDEVRELLEGTRETLPNGDAKISAPLNSLLVEEAKASAIRKSAGRESLSACVAAGAGADIYGNRPKNSAASETIVCTNCGMQLSANRFAPHLERCMLGKGRASARQARDAMRANPDG